MRDLCPNCYIIIIETNYLPLLLANTINAMNGTCHFTTKSASPKDGNLLD